MPTHTIVAPGSTTRPLLDFSRPPARFLDVGHARLAYRKLGTGPDLLFIHGWPLSSATFRDVAPLLAPRFTCHLIDLPGAGFSTWDREAPISIQGHAETVRRAARALELERYGIVAHDSGAAIGRFAAALEPERVAAIVMGNTEIPGYLSPLMKALVRFVRLPGSKALFRFALRWRPFRRSNLGLGTCFANRDLLDGEFHRLTVEPLLRSKAAFAGQMALVSGFDVTEFDDLAAVHPRIAAPVQLIWGDADPWFPLSEARRMTAEFPGGCELQVLPAGKVLAHEEFPERFVGHALPFLERAFGRSASAGAEPGLSGQE